MSKYCTPSDTADPERFSSLKIMVQTISEQSPAQLQSRMPVGERLKTW